MKKIIISIVVVVAVVGVVYAFQRGNQEAPSATATPSVTVSVSPSVSPTEIVPTATPTATAVSSVKTFTVTGKSFSFSVSQITVNKGDTVKIIFQNTEGNHDWVVDEFNAHTKVISAGQSDTIQFIADKTGTFQYYCSVGAHRQLGMVGNLIVK